MVNEKKRKKIETKIAMIEALIRKTLAVKANGTPEIDIARLTRQLSELRREIA